jgi:hypothetical protein
MIDIKKAIKDAEEIIDCLKARKDELLAEIKKGNKSLYKEYIDVCSDWLGLVSNLEKLKKAI